MSPAKILVVDDDPQIRRLVGGFLGREFEVSLAADAVGAVSAARRELPDLVLLDFSLPAGNGLVVLERLRSIPSLATTPVVMISGWGAPWSWKTLLDMDVSGFLPKPFSKDELLAEIEHALAADAVAA
jgi:two-component system OmpR family response regulator